MLVPQSPPIPVILASPSPPPPPSTSGLSSPLLLQQSSPSPSPSFSSSDLPLTELIPASSPSLDLVSCSQSILTSTVPSGADPSSCSTPSVPSSPVPSDCCLEVEVAAAPGSPHPSRFRPIIQHLRSFYIIWLLLIILTTSYFLHGSSMVFQPKLSQEQHLNLMPNDLSQWSPWKGSNRQRAGLSWEERQRIHKEEEETSSGRRGNLIDVFVQQKASLIPISTESQTKTQIIRIKSTLKHPAPIDITTTPSPIVPSSSSTVSFHEPVKPIPGDADPDLAPTSSSIIGEPLPHMQGSPSSSSPIISSNEAPSNTTSHKRESEGSSSLEGMNRRTRKHRKHHIVSSHPSTAHHYFLHNKCSRDDVYIWGSRIRATRPKSWGPDPTSYATMELQSHTYQEPGRKMDTWITIKANHSGVYLCFSKSGILQTSLDHRRSVSCMFKEVVTDTKHLSFVSVYNSDWAISFDVKGRPQPGPHSSSTHLHPCSHFTKRHHLTRHHHSHHHPQIPSHD